MLRTLNTTIALTGVGLHGGEHVDLTIAPAAFGSGIVFVRSDLIEAGAEAATALIPARYDLVTDTRLCTRLTNEHGTSIGTVEHLMAALAGCGVTDVEITVSAPEVPIMDGSSEPFVHALIEAGFADSDRACPAIRILKPVRVELDGKIAELRPADRFEIDFRIEFDDDAIGTQEECLEMVNGAFVRHLSDCRTFGKLKEVEYMRSLGLARGGSLQNAIVIDEGRILNPEGLRRPTEFVRHKILDAVGDLALAGAPIIGRYCGVKSGHDMTNRLLHALFDQPGAWTWDTLEEGQGMGGVMTAPARDRVASNLSHAEAVAV
ncbi:MAG: UDP-3-O-acyl-N-acetylglucosamine deacetylase [Pseudomonadota bacterium]